MNPVSSPPTIAKERTKAKQRASYTPMADNPLRCPVCKTFLKKQKDGPKICVPCYFRNKAKEQAELKQANPTAPVKTNVRIGKL